MIVLSDDLHTTTPRKGHTSVYSNTSSFLDEAVNIISERTKGQKRMLQNAFAMLFVNRNMMHLHP